MNESRIRQLDDEIARAKADIIESQNKKALAMRLGRLQAERKRLVENSGIVRNEDTILEEIRATRTRFEELNKDPNPTNQFRMLGLSQKLERLESELQSLREPGFTL